LVLNIVLQLSLTVFAGVETSQSGSSSSQNRIDGVTKYKNDASEVITLRVPGATSYDITFTNVMTEKDFDIIEVFDKKGNLIQSLSGEHSRMLVVVNSAVAEIKFTSDESQTETGFDVSWKTTVKKGTEDGGGNTQALMNKINDLKDRVKKLSKGKGKQVFFDHGLVSDFSAKSMTTLQIERQYHTNNAWINLQREFICKSPGFYEVTVSGSSGSVAPTIVRLEHFSMKRQDEINNGRWVTVGTAAQVEPFGPFGTGCIVEVQEDDKIRVQFNGTLIDDPRSRIFHLIAAKFA